MTRHQTASWPYLVTVNIKGDIKFSTKYGTPFFTSSYAVDRGDGPRYNKRVWVVVPTPWQFTPCYRVKDKSGIEEVLQDYADEYNFGTKTVPGQGTPSGVLPSHIEVTVSMLC
jgi:hypothetical protein